MHLLPSCSSSVRRLHRHGRGTGNRVVLLRYVVLILGRGHQTRRDVCNIATTCVAAQPWCRGSLHRPVEGPRSRWEAEGIDRQTDRQTAKGPAALAGGAELGDGAVGPPSCFLVQPPSYTELNGEGHPYFNGKGRAGGPPPVGGQPWSSCPADRAVDLRIYNRDIPLLT